MINQGENLVVTGTPSLDYFINHKAKMKNNMLFMHRIGLLIIKTQLHIQHSKKQASLCSITQNKTLNITGFSNLIQC